MVIDSRIRVSHKEVFVRLRWIIIAVTLVFVIGYWLMMSNLPYPIEIRELDPDGTVLYKLQRYADWPTSETIAAIRKHRFDRIYHSVYYHGLEYSFSKSGRVHATQGGETGAPQIYVREWNYTGDPYHFPFYDFSNTWDTGHP